MIDGFRHKGLRQLFENDNPRGLNAEHVRKIRQILTVMHAAQSIAALDIPTFRLHPLKCDLQGFWSITVRARTGGSSSGSRMAAPSTSIWWTTIEGDECDAFTNEEPGPSRGADRGQPERAWRLDQCRREDARHYPPAASQPDRRTQRPDRRDGGAAGEGAG